MLNGSFKEIEVQLKTEITARKVASLCVMFAEKI